MKYKHANSGGATNSERYLKKLCDRTFLSLWSYSGVYRDQGNGDVGSDAQNPISHKGHGKELCDLLVVFENKILIFSDKDCKYNSTNNPIQDWARWYVAAIDKSAKQIWGAERWIRQFPNRLFLDRACTQKFPVSIPPIDKAKFHRIVVAHGTSHPNREINGCAKSLKIIPAIVGPMHYDRNTRSSGQPEAKIVPFAVGQVNPAKGFVHILDDKSLDVVLLTRDTIADFLEYLEKKEAFITSGYLEFGNSEEDLLATYLSSFQQEGGHNFIVPHGFEKLFIHGGLWESFVRSPQRRAKIIADEVSYTWDRNIERRTNQYKNSNFYSPPGIDPNKLLQFNFDHHEKLLRIFAKESRLARRALSIALLELIERGKRYSFSSSVIKPKTTGRPYYIFSRSIDLTIFHMKGTDLAALMLL